MAINPKERAALQLDFETSTKLSCSDFCCPITLSAIPAAELINGHVVNESIKSESEKTPSERKTIIQWGKLDNYYGHTIEPDLIDFLNVRFWDTQKMFFEKGKKSTTATGSSGKTYPIFDPDPKSVGELVKKNKFPRIGLANKSGATFSRPFVKDAPIDEFAADTQVILETNIQFSQPSLVGSFWKSAYLSLVRMLGYKFVFSIMGRFIREPLARFFLAQGTKENAINFFGHLRGSCSVMFNPDINLISDTTSDNRVLFHSDDEMLFAVSCIFRLNGKTFTVAMPACLLDKDWPVVLSCYYRFIKDRTMPHIIKPAQFKDNRWHVDSEPLVMKFLTEIPPELKDKIEQFGPYHSSSSPMQKK